MKQNFYILIDSEICGSFLLTRCLKYFDGCDAWKGVLVREPEPSEQIRKQRQEFHNKYAGETDLSPDAMDQLMRIYPTTDTVEKAMIRLDGFPAHAPSNHPNTIFLGKNANSSYAKDLFQTNCEKDIPWIFLHTQQILQPWWIELTEGKLVNSHSAVLPFARGLNAIENVAATKEVETFKKVVGFTIHYINEGIDTGPIIRAERITDPFRFNSLWELKAYVYLSSYTVYLETLSNIISYPERCPVGIAYDSSLKGPNFLKKDFTPDIQQKAEEAYLSMKKEQGYTVDI